MSPEPNVQPTVRAPSRDPPASEATIRVSPDATESGDMRIGIVSDIHANLPALEAVLEDMPAVDEIVCGGDVVGYNPWPRACLERVRELATVTVQGNHDRTVETPGRYAGNRMAEAGLERAKEELSAAQLEWLAALPRTETFGDGRYLLVHSHPERLGAYVYPRQFPELRPYVEEYDGLVLGHTHIQHEARIDDRLVLNPGSVGQPRDEDPRAAYAVLDTETGELDLRRVEYDIQTVYDEIAATGLPERTGERLFEGR
jgi:putative phosphoesterase